jgi:hypothetical protein
MKDYGGIDVQIHIFFTSTLFGSERSAYVPAALTPVSIKYEAGWASGTLCRRENS